MIKRVKSQKIIRLISVFLCLCLAFLLSTCASATRVIISTRIVSCTLIDNSIKQGHFHVNVNITNTFTGYLYDISPASWTLEWQALKNDKTVYTRNKRTGRFGISVASNSEEFCLPALKDGYFRYRMIVSNSTETVTGEWMEYYISSIHSGGTGIHRVIIK